MGIQGDLYIWLVRVVTYYTYIHCHVCYNIISIEARCKESAKILMKYNDRIPVSLFSTYCMQGFPSPYPFALICLFAPVCVGDCRESSQVYHSRYR